MQCIAAAQGHDGSVAAISWTSRVAPFARGDRASHWIISAGADGSVKRWDVFEPIAHEDDVSSLASSEPQLSEIDCVASEPAHSKGINAVSVSPNDRVIAVAS